MLKLNRKGLFPASIVLYAYLTLFIFFILILFGVVFLISSNVPGGSGKPGGSILTKEKFVNLDFDILDSYLNYEFKCNKETYKISDYIPTLVSDPTLISLNMDINNCMSFSEVTEQFFSTNFKFLKNGPEKHFQVFIPNIDIYPDEKRCNVWINKQLFCLIYGKNSISGLDYKEILTNENFENRNFNYKITNYFSNLLEEDTNLIILVYNFDIDNVDRGKL